jgi:hypothetical protein
LRVVNEEPFALLFAESAMLIAARHSKPIFSNMAELKLQISINIDIYVFVFDMKLFLYDLARNG